MDCGSSGWNVPGAATPRRHFQQQSPFLGVDSNTVERSGYPTHLIAARNTVYPDKDHPDQPHRSRERQDVDRLDHWENQTGLAGPDAPARLLESLQISK